ncbi:hypothetical protein MMC28_000536 [Mycoblastus sanguinarius]|nr:hypothetical protein [Mycoblastus sanguinarius]
MAPNRFPLPISLLDLLRNSLVLRQISPYLGITGLVTLAATSISFQSLIYNTPHVFSRADLSKLKSCLEVRGPYSHYADVEQSSLSTDDYYAQPLQIAFYSLRQHNLLQDVRTLILDGLAVPATIITEILCDEAYNIRILSLRGVKELGDEKLIQILRYIIRSSRPQGTPKLKGLYYFSAIQPTSDYLAADLRRHFATQHRQAGVTNTVGAQLGGDSGAFHAQPVRSSLHQANPWYSASGELLKLHFEDQWASLMQACEGLIAFDAVLCRHPVDPEGNLDSRPKTATISLGGCQSCGSCPEGPAFPGKSIEARLPMLAPPPFHSPHVKAAQRLENNGLPHPAFIARCRACLKDRWCERCNTWWCESCYAVPKRRTPASMAVTPMGAKNFDEKIKVHNDLCVSKCLMDELLNRVGEGGMWG